MKDSNANYEALMKSFLELTELKHILRKTQTFFEEVSQVFYFEGRKREMEMEGERGGSEKGEKERRGGREGRREILVGRQNSLRGTYKH